ncbi:MAG TPA: nicotinate phosphoribosyltransferase, partial [Oleiagrimonas sp.]|nr:nicotinate phosphoribosyltransferase [Oleiagrimonas sp.]
MMQAVLHRFPSAHVEYRFHCRTPGSAQHVSVARVREEIAALCSLSFRRDELDYLRSLRYLKKDFVE